MCLRNAVLNYIILDKGHLTQLTNVGEYIIALINGCPIEYFRTNNVSVKNDCGVKLYVRFRDDVLLVIANNPASIMEYFCGWVHLCKCWTLST